MPTANTNRIAAMPRNFGFLPRPGVGLVLIPWLLLGGAGCADDMNNDDAVAAQSALIDPHMPDLKGIMTGCGSLLNSGAVGFMANIPLAGGTFQADIPGSNPFTGDCNGVSFVSTDGGYDSLKIRADYGGPEINFNSGKQNAADCPHSSVAYAVYDFDPVAGYVPRGVGYSFGRYKSGGLFNPENDQCIHDWNPMTAPRPLGAQTFSMSNSKKAVIAVWTWQHNDPAFGHTGAYCDMELNCQWPTRLTVTRSGPHAAPKLCGGQFAGPNGCLNQYVRFSFGGAFLMWGGTGAAFLSQDTSNTQADRNHRFDFEAPDANNRFRIKSYQSSLCMASVAGGARNPVAIPCSACGGVGNSCQWTFTGYPSSFTMIKNVGSNKCMWSRDGNLPRASAFPIEQRDCVLGPETMMFLDYAPF